MNDIFNNAFGLQGKNILITGGRSGLGFAMAQCVANAGGFPIIVGSSSESVIGEAVKKLPAGAGFQFDVRETEKAPDFASFLIEKYGHIDGLVNNAGVHCKKPFEETTIDDFQRVIDVHVFGSYALTQAVAPYMIRAKRGSIIFISSMSAMIGLTKVSTYGAAKSAVLGLVKCLTGDLSPYGIRVNAISPGFIDTPMFHQAVDKDPDRQKKIIVHTPLGKYGNPIDVGWAVVYLCSDASSFITGVNLPVDGGCNIGF